VIIWAMERAEGTCGAHTSDPALLDAVTRYGISPISARSRLKEGNLSLPNLTCGRSADGRPDLDCEDMIYFGWIPVFSVRALELLIDIGCRKNDFLQCICGTTEERWMHLPVESIDLIDYQRSEFTMIVSQSPFIPFRVVRLVEKEQQTVPPCFRAALSGTDQVLSDVLVMDSMRLRWEDAGFTGAIFRRVTE
jgi:hypothetical protein